MSIFEKNKGTKLDPYRIYTEDDLFELTTYSEISNPNKYYQLQNDIELTREWTPIGSSENLFKGIFDGGGFFIRNMNINSSSSYSGFFGYVENATIVNTHIDGATISSNGGLHGTLVGRVSGKSRIFLCSVENASINMTNASSSGSGGLVGYVRDATLRMSNISIKDIRIDKVRSSAYGSGGLVGRTALSDIYVDNVMFFGDIYLQETTSSYDTRKSNLVIVDARNRFSSINVIQATDSSTHDIPLKISNPRLKSSYPSSILFDPYFVWDMEDGDIPHLTLKGGGSTPIIIRDLSDFPKTESLGVAHYKLEDDIIVEEPFTGVYFFEEDWKGILDGNGYGIKDITVANEASGSTTMYSLFESLSGELHNLEIEYNEVIRESGPLEQTRGALIGSTLITNNLYGVLSNVRVVVHGDNINGNSNYGLVKGFYSGSRMENCSLHSLGDFRARSNAYFTQVCLFGDFAQEGSFILNNVAIAGVVAGGGSRTNIIRSSSDATVDNNVILKEGLQNLYSSTGFTVLNLMSDFLDSDNPVYDNFDRDIWSFESGEPPIQSVFIKITEKVEERLISLYSKGMYLESRWTKGFKNILNFFTNKSGSSTRTKRSPFRRLLSFTKDISLKMLFKKVGQKRVKSNSGLVVSNITKLKKLTETILSYSNKITSNYSKIKSGARMLEIYSDKISFRTIEIKKSLKKAVNYSKGIRDNLLKKITRRHNRKTQSFSGNISSDVLHSYLTRVTEKVMSYSGHMRGIIRRASNKYDFEFRMVSNQANKITIRFRRFIRTMRMTRSHSGMITTFVRRLSRISAPTEIFARAVARTNSIRMKVKESFTKIRASNGGGD